MGIVCLCACNSGIRRLISTILFVSNRVVIEWEYKLWNTTLTLTIKIKYGCKEKLDLYSCCTNNETVKFVSVFIPPNIPSNCIFSSRNLFIEADFRIYYNMWNSIDAEKSKFIIKFYRRNFNCIFLRIYVHVLFEWLDCV